MAPAFYENYETPKTLGNLTLYVFSAVGISMGYKAMPFRVISALDTESG